MTPKEIFLELLKKEGARNACWTSMKPCRWHWEIR